MAGGCPTRGDEATASDATGVEIVHAHTAPDSNPSEKIVSAAAVLARADANSATAVDTTAVGEGAALRCERTPARGFAARLLEMALVRRTFSYFGGSRGGTPPSHFKETASILEGRVLVLSQAGRCSDPLIGTGRAPGSHRRADHGAGGEASRVGGGDL